MLELDHASCQALCMIAVRFTPAHAAAPLLTWYQRGLYFITLYGASKPFMACHDAALWCCGLSYL